MQAQVRQNPSTKKFELVVEGKVVSEAVTWGHWNYHLNRFKKGEAKLPEVLKKHDVTDFELAPEVQALKDAEDAKRAAKAAKAAAVVVPPVSKPTTPEPGTGPLSPQAKAYQAAKGKRDPQPKKSSQRKR